MAQARITINATVGSNPPNGTALPIGTLVNLNNVDAGGEVTYYWELLDIPEGSSATLSNPNIVNPSFTPDVEGSYLIKLTVNRTLSTEVTNTVIAGIAQVKSGMRVPAAGESREENTLRGWAEDMNRNLGLLDRQIADSGCIVAVAGGSLSRGDVVRITNVFLIKPGLPGKETLPLVTKAVASNQADMDSTLYVVDSGIGGSGAVTLYQLVRVRLIGLIGPLALAGSAGDPLYVSDTATMQPYGATSVTYTRRIGTLAFQDGVNWWVEVQGFLGHHEGMVYLHDANSGSGITQVDNASGAVLNIVTLDVAGGIILGVGDASHGIAVAVNGLYAMNPMRAQGFQDPVDAQDLATKAYADAHAGITAARSQLCFGNSDTPNGATDHYLDPGFGARTTPSSGGNYPSIKIVKPGSLSQLYVHAAVGPIGGNLEVTVRVNGGDSTVTTVLTAATTDAIDLTHTVNVVAGDIVTMHLKSAGAIVTGAQEITATMLYTI